MKRTVPMITTGIAALLFALGGGAGAQIVNINARLYGFNFPTDPAPVPGQLIKPFSLASDHKLNQRTLGAGTYRVTNATGMPGADPDFTSWRFNGVDNWVWTFVIADDATDKVVFYGEAGIVQDSQAKDAADPAVQNFSGEFTLSAPATLDFMVRDYDLSDNAGGVAIWVSPVGSTNVPEPGAVALLASGGVTGIGLLARRRRARR